MSSITDSSLNSKAKAALIFLQLLLIALIPPVIIRGHNFYLNVAPWDAMFNSILLNTLSLFVCTWVQQRFEKHPQKHPIAHIIPISLTIYAISLFLLIVTRFPYSIKAILLGFSFTPIFLATLHVLQRKNKPMQFLVVPLGNALSLKSSNHYKFKMLNTPSLPKIGFVGVVVDFHSNVLTSDWERFLARCALKRVPVYNVMQLKETMTGMVNVEHLAENDFGDLAPSRVQMVVKRFLDVLFLLLLSPVLIPLMLLIAFWITIDSPGGAIFVQKRMGLNGNHFNVFKFRSMIVNHKGSHFTEVSERHRITKFGKVIRKYRLDELPQFWNVLKGEMSLIGPRPESVELANLYEKDVPFFAYRHVVRPGISGWAQVMQGYAAGVDEMKEKLAYDFYYIKHFSLWLDLLIWYKTIKTVVTGFGSR